MLKCSIPFRDCALKSVRRGLLLASPEYGGCPIGELTNDCEETADSFPTPDIPHEVPIIWDLLSDIRRVQAPCFWDPNVSDITENTYKAPSPVTWNSLLCTDAHLPLPASVDVQQIAALENHRFPLTVSICLQSLHSTAGYWRTNRKVELSASGTIGQSA